MGSFRLDHFLLNCNDLPCLCLWFKGVNLWVAKDLFGPVCSPPFSAELWSWLPPLGSFLNFMRTGCNIGRLVEALEREKEPQSVGAGDYAEAHEKGRDRLLAERIENILGNTTSQFIETH